MIATWILVYREIIRFIRQPMRLVSSLAQPLFFWIFLGTGFSEIFVIDEAGMDYREFAYPGIILMLMLFSSIFSTITLIEDRNMGFLQGVIVAPVSRASIVWGKLIGGTLIALFQVLIFLLFIPTTGINLSVWSFIVLLCFCSLIGFGFTGMGFYVAWRSETVASYHAIMSVVFIPMWLLSGALFPSNGVADWLVWLMSVNPVTYAMKGLRTVFYTQPIDLLGDVSFMFSLLITVGWALFTVSMSMRSIHRNL
tara:strand:- start:637 stop:1395 length:759 start_codon:yes stop_codon:yes gene_type:complete